MKRRIFIFILGSLLLGCQKMDLHHGLQEIEADEILNLLNQQGIEAKKEKEISGQEVSWKISVKPRDNAQARQILIANNLPRKRELGLSGVYKDKGLIPTPDEQKARFLLALKGEIINSLEKIPGIVDVDVVLNVPERDEFSELDSSERRPTASVIAKIRPTREGPVAITEGKIQRFVANSVQELNPNDVAVILTQMETGAAPTGHLLLPTTPAPLGGAAKPAVFVELAGLRIGSDSVMRMKAYFIGLLSLLVFVAGGLLVTLLRLNRLRVRLQSGSVEAMPLHGREGRPLLEEGGAEERGGVAGTFDTETPPRR